MLLFLGKLSRALTGLLDEKIFSNVTDENIVDTIGDYKWIRNRYINLGILDQCPEEYQLQNGVRKILQEKLTNQTLIDRLARFGTSPTEISKYYFLDISEAEWKKSGNAILFNDFISIFDAARITKGLILFDELEKIIVSQNTQERRSFCEELRYWFIDGDNQNSRKSFYNILFVIHPYIQEILNPHWNASGLERFATLGGQFSADYTIYFKPVSGDKALPLAEEYIKHSRIQDFDENSIAPFDEESLSYALNKTFYVPGKFLSFLHLSLEKAIEEKWDSITKDKIDKILISSSSNSENKDDDYDVNIEVPKPKISF